MAAAEFVGNKSTVNSATKMSQPKALPPANGSLKPGGVSHFRKRLIRIKDAIGLRHVIIFVTVSLISAFSFSVLNVSKNLLEENKLQDVWSIYYLDMENLARLLSDSLVPKLNPQDIVPGSDSLLAIPDLRWSAASIYELHSDVGMKHVSGPTLPVKNLSDFGVKRQNELSKWNLLAYAGKRYAANLLAPLSGDVSDVTNVQRRLAIMPFARELSPSVANAARGNALIYIATRQGQLVFRNATRVTQANFHQRNLVQMFVELPIWKGQIAIPNGEGRDIYGFFVNVPQTNLVIFAETDKSEVIQKVKDATRRLFTMVTIGILSISFFLFIFLSRMLSGIGQVAKLALTISTGDFSVKVPTAGFGELKTLTQAFSRMVAGLQQRDLVIAGLNKEQIEKVRLAGELEIARGIQENLLPVEELPKENGLRVQALYRPAGECAGDWYGYFYDKPSQITMVFIVDISGHGAGSSIFTAIAAAIFEDFRVSFTFIPVTKSPIATIRARIMARNLSSHSLSAH